MKLACKWVRLGNRWFEIEQGRGRGGSSCPRHCSVWPALTSGIFITALRAETTPLTGKGMEAIRRGEIIACVTNECLNQSSSPAGAYGLPMQPWSDSMAENAKGTKRGWVSEQVKREQGTMRRGISGSWRQCLSWAWLRPSPSFGSLLFFSQSPVGPALDTCMEGSPPHHLLTAQERRNAHLSPPPRGAPVWALMSHKTGASQWPIYSLRTVPVWEEMGAQGLHHHHPVGKGRGQPHAHRISSSFIIFLGRTPPLLHA